MNAEVSMLRRLGLGLFGCALLLAAAGCHKGSEQGESGSVTLRVGDQGKGLELPLEISGQDKGRSYALEWTNFADGPHMNAAFIADAIDIGTMGDTPVLLAQAARADLVVIAARRVEPNSYVQIVARPGTGIHTLADLRGKRVAFTMICPLLSGPETMIVWTTKGTWNAEQEAQAGRDHRQAA